MKTLLMVPYLRQPIPDQKISYPQMNRFEPKK